jgi:predicted dehydrogenase
VNIAIIGCAAVAARMHLRKYAESTEAQIVGCVDVVEERARHPADLAGGAEVFIDCHEQTIRLPLGGVPTANESTG